MRPIWIFACVLALSLPLVFAPPASAAIVTTDLTTLTPTQLAQTLVSSSFPVSNATFTGASIAGGTFTGGTQAIGFDSGVILSTGNIASVVGPNTSPSITTENGQPGDPDLDKLASFPTYDAAVLQFDFVPTTPTISFQYVFSSDEYNEFVNTSFNDVFGFFINGVNCAVVGTPAKPVTINTINDGNPVGSTPNSHPELYRNNDFQAPNPAPFDTEMDGLTKVLTCFAIVHPGVTNHAKLAIADASDDRYDSNVFLKSGSIGSTTLPPPLQGKTGNAAPVSGKVFVRLPHTKTFVPLSQAAQIPVGSELDTTKGRVRLTTSAGGAKSQTADFYQGRFLFQQGAKKPLVTLPLSAPLACPKRFDSASAGKKKRKLWGSGKGKYRTKGKNASATVRGTIWLTQDTCAGTLVKVKRGVVDVLDFKRHKHVLVHAGHSYFAKR
ncbi:MAG TPA: choice-of-anchor L domain-containing protein [Gaiellaceae bacterium]|nr:choice-of-anchor L domain-containing protein [Gaiellaceae bacterium]